MRVISLLVVALLSACASSPLPIHPLDPKNLDQSTQFVGPNGGTAYLTRCDDGVGCYQRAREACSKGYAIFDSIDSASGTISNGGGVVSSFHYIAFECKQ